MSQEKELHLSQMIAINRVYKEYINSPIALAYIACIDALSSNEFFKKLDDKQFPDKRINIRIAVWEIWLKFKDNESKKPQKQINRELLRVVNEVSFNEMKKKYASESHDFIEIINKFVITARKRLIALPRCNLWDWLRLKWYIFKKYTIGLTEKEKAPLNDSLLFDEYQFVYCSRIVAQLENKEEKKKTV